MTNRVVDVRMGVHEEKRGADVYGVVVVPKFRVTILVNPKEWRIFVVIDVEIPKLRDKVNRAGSAWIFPFQFFTRVVHLPAS